jgi:hypothetical protein
MFRHQIDLAGALQHGLHFPAWIGSGSGYIASALVLATFCMTSMLRLRMAAIGSNVAFIFYAAVADIRPVLILHIILLPVNVYRLLQVRIAVVTARRLLVEPDAEVQRGELAEPHFLSHAAVADPGAALPLAEREQERVVRLLAARVPSEAATASGIDAQAAAAAAPHLLDEIDRFLAALGSGNPSPAQLAHMAHLHSRNEVLRASHETLGELAALLRKPMTDRPADIAASIAEGLGALLLHADEAARTHAPEDVELLSHTTEDRSAVVERIRATSIAEAATGSAADHRAVYAMTALYERAVWLLHRYAALLGNRTAAHDVSG